MDWNKILSDVLNAVLIAVVPAVIGLAVAWVKAKTAEIYASLDENKRWAFDAAIRTAVFAAEQIYDSGQGAEKLQYAYNYVVKWLDDRNLDIDVDAIITKIEATVHDYMNGERPTSRINGLLAGE